MLGHSLIERLTDESHDGDDWDNAEDNGDDRN